MTHIGTATYRTRDFALLAGVTVRALHYYDRLGLLTPRRNSAGHRVYAERDLESIQRIVALKRIGVPLKEIARLGTADGADLAAVLRAKRASLDTQRRALARLVSTLRDTEDAIASGSRTLPALLRRIIEVMDMTNEDDEWATIIREGSRHRRSLPPGVLADLGTQSEALLKEIVQVLDEAPDSLVVQQLAVRWVNLLQRINGTTVPLSALLRTGQSTFNDHLAKSPGLASSPWARSIDLMNRAVAAQGLVQ